MTLRMLKILFQPSWGSRPESIFRRADQVRHQCQRLAGRQCQRRGNLRTGWLDEPSCQQCHTGSVTQNNGQLRYTSVFDANGVPRVPVSQLFATNPDTPLAGKSLYRFSKGHGGIQCSACHGSTHAEFPAAHRNDNLQSYATQGHAGTLSNCTSCHSTMPNTVSGGPHGSVALPGIIATYYPETDFAGADSFTFAAFDGFADSNLATVSVTVGNPATTATLDNDGDQWPDLVEYALGYTIGYPNAPISQKMAFRDLSGTRYWTMSLPRGPVPGDASAEIDFSSDLIHWVPGVTINNSPFLLEVRDPNPAVGQPKRFTRIRASRP